MTEVTSNNMGKTPVKAILKDLRANHSKSNKFEGKDEASEQKIEL